MKVFGGCGFRGGLCNLRHRDCGAKCLEKSEIRNTQRWKEGKREGREVEKGIGRGNGEGKRGQRESKIPLWENFIDLMAEPGSRRSINIQCRGSIL
jgi:hypothetical protein